MSGCSAVFGCAVRIGLMLFAAVTFLGCGQSSPQSQKPAEAAAEPQRKVSAELEAVESEPEPAAETPPEKMPESEPEPAIVPKEDPEAAADLGPPLVEDPTVLTPLDPVKPLWLDRENKRLVMVGQVCQTGAPLELFACLRNTKEHEAVVSVDVVAMAVHAGLLGVGAQVGQPARFTPQYVPASGTEIEVTVVWMDSQGERKTARAQDWVLDVQTGQAMAHPWVFAGSGVWEDEMTGQKYYQAEGGDFICVSNFPSAMLDLPIESSQANSELLYQAFTERIPPIGTPVTLLLVPQLEAAEEAD